MPLLLLLLLLSVGQASSALFIYLFFIVFKLMVIKSLMNETGQMLQSCCSWSWFCFVWSSPWLVDLAKVFIKIIFIFFLPFFNNGWLSANLIVSWANNECVLFAELKIPQLSCSQWKACRRQKQTVYYIQGLKHTCNRPLIRFTYIALYIVCSFCLAE